MKLSLPTLLILPLGLISSVSALAAASIEIRNKLSKYAIAVDTKNYDSLSNVFTSDADFTFPDSDPAKLVQYKGLPAIQVALAASLGNALTQHSITTTVVDFDGDCKANSTAYLVATYFGKGNLTGKVLTLFGTYKDEWTLGAGWKIKTRVLTGLPIIGDVAIFQQR
ncbi:MAG: hypothetical protein M1814_004650 [Vezdaea aestivalis]|nr:MAG: hypothetical protein M1814_004650 [Vezdaea aestivalis]